MPYSRYYRSRLPGEEQAAYDALCVGFEAQKEEIALPRAGVDNLNRLMYAIKYDNPQFFYVDYHIILQKTSDWARAKVSYRDSFDVTGWKKREILAEVLAFSCRGFPQPGKDFFSGLLAFFAHAHPVFTFFLTKIRGFLGKSLSFGRSRNIGLGYGGINGGKGKRRREKYC